MGWSTFVGWSIWVGVEHLGEVEHQCGGGTSVWGGASRWGWNICVGGASDRKQQLQVGILGISCVIRVSAVE